MLFEITGVTREVCSTYLFKYHGNYILYEAGVNKCGVYGDNPYSLWDFQRTPRIRAYVPECFEFTVTDETCPWPLPDPTPTPTPTPTPEPVCTQTTPTSEGLDFWVDPTDGIQCGDHVDSWLGSYFYTPSYQQVLPSKEDCATQLFRLSGGYMTWEVSTKTCRIFSGNAWENWFYWSWPETKVYTPGCFNFQYKPNCEWPTTTISPPP